MSCRWGVAVDAAVERQSSCKRRRNVRDVSSMWNSPVEGGESGRMSCHGGVVAVDVVVGGK